MTIHVSLNVVAVVCAHNEAARIGQVLRVLTTYPGFKEVVVVDDGSSDGTEWVARAFPVRLIRHVSNRGKGQAMSSAVVEALVDSIADQAVSAGVVQPATAGKATAGKIDDLYPTGAFHNHRATLGGARDFARTYRNISSHPAQTPPQVVEKIRRCKAGFFDALRIAAELRATIQSLGYQVRVA